MAIINGNNFNNVLNGIFDPTPFPFGPDRNDIINGFGGNDIIQALGTDDIINPGNGVDNTNAGAGNDRVIDNDFVNFDIHNGGIGIDTIDYSGVTFTSGNVTINLATAFTSVAGGNTERIFNFENVEGSQGGETIIGTSDVNVIDGNGGNDVINAGGAADRTNGDVGDDRIIDDDFVNFDIHNGGIGIDTIDYSSVTFASGNVTINLDTEQTSVTGGNTERILNFENVEGSQGGETIIGTSDVNVINSNDGDDVINAGDEADRTNGGAGNDRIVDDDFVNFDVHNGGIGIDTIDYSSVTFASGNVTINLATAFTSVAGGNTERIFNFENVEGSQGGETIIGTSDVNVINGNDGDDIIFAGQGNDTITGGAGDDYLNGTNFTAQGTRERDTLISGGLDDTDIFVLGGRQGFAGRVFYNDFGNADYAILQDFDVYNFPGDIADKIQLLGSASNYRISNIMVDGISGAGISFQGDLIGVVQGVSASNLNLNDSNQFMYV